jgi:hypothetical protein
MKNIVLKFGLISGAAISAMMAIMVPLLLSGRVDFSGSELVGYTSMVLAFLAVFIGIRTYRESSGGTITFGRAFQVGILITLVASTIYVVTWQIIYYNFLPDFADRYAALTVANMKSSGATAAAIAAEEQKLAQFKEWYRNPFLNVAMTFVEIFPAGLIVTLISAAILRRKTPPSGRPATAALA